ncbi:DUF1127 domain-containing protein [Roseibium sp. FZY0029]|uniref:DUF1127 domain-containing protein n=1 Tax=Roseibium sp. FZY0029 TaxID=3116647 RepID=UPI002EC425EB|nr:DUF1127 domain-containing protein [Roseibium sp. FZY0029]
MSLEIDTIFRSRANSRGVLFSALRVCVAEFRNYLRRRETHRALSRLSESELKDIGLQRTELGYSELHDDRFKLGPRRG